MRFGWTLFVTFALTLGVAALPGAARADQHLDAEAAAHDAVDKNDDGVIDRGEFQILIIEIYYLADDDKDGTLTQKELEEVEPGVFEAADANEDDKLTLREYENARFGDYEAADTDDDGVVSLPEAETFDAKIESEAK
jgi:hypothetical protein